MREKILVDTGPLAAIFNPDDARHHEAASLLKAFPFPLYTCLPVISEAHWLLRRRFDSLRNLHRACESGALQLLALENGDFGGILTVLQEYERCSPDFADAALVHLARRERLHVIATFDYRDFSVYRSFEQRPFQIAALE